MGAHTAVRRLSAEVAGKKAETRFTDAERPVHKYFQFAGGVCMDVADFFQAQFPCQHRPRNSPAAHRVCRLRARNIELRRSVEFELGEVFMRHLNQSEILHDDAVRTDIV